MPGRLLTARLHHLADLAELHKLSLARVVPGLTGEQWMRRAQLAHKIGMYHKAQASSKPDAKPSPTERARVERNA